MWWEGEGGPCYMISRYLMYLRILIERRMNTPLTHSSHYKEPFLSLLGKAHTRWSYLPTPTFPVPVSKTPLRHHYLLLLVDLMAILSPPPSSTLSPPLSISPSPLPPTPFSSYPPSLPLLSSSISPLSTYLPPFPSPSAPHPHPSSYILYS